MLGIQIFHVEIFKEVIEVVLPVHQPGPVGPLDDLGLFPHIGNLPDQTFHDIFQGDDPLDTSELVRDDAIFHTCLLELFQRIIHTLVFRHKLRRTNHLRQREIRLVDTAEQVFQIDDAFDIVKLSGSNRIDVEKIFLDFLAYLLDTVRQIQPDKLAAVCHDRTDITVAQIEHAFHDVLLDFLHFADIKAFFDNRLDLLLRHLVFFSRIGSDQSDGQRRTLG